jgi:uncharacterized phiE125 gp8 family phage protein
MRFVRTTDATVEPVTLQEILDHTLVENEADYPYLVGLAKKARLTVERRYSRQLVTATWKGYAENFPAEIELRVLPVIAVSSITYVDPDGATQTLSASNYQTSVVGKDWPGRIMPAYGYTWPSVRGDTYDAVCVTFTAGYGQTAASVPEDVRHWILATVAHWYQFREPVITGTIVSSLPHHIDGLLAGLDWGNYG